ncbi:MAG: polysaccharide biosynthesis tyrosine autokinase [Alphaproteobacteria bacterium]|nr:polysaccharide biosynthesis tyrosine autokinase [Alphaproteobacteria bacterium]
MVQFLPQPPAPAPHGYISPTGPSFHNQTAPTPAPATDIFDLKSLLAVLLRRKYLVLSVLVAFVAFVAVVLEQIEPIYRGEAEIIVEGGDNRSIGSLIDEFGLDRGSIQTEASIIKSRELTEKVVQELGLVDDPVFNPALQREQSDAVDLLMGLLFGLFGDRPDRAVAPRQANEDEKLNRAVEEFIDNLTVITRTNSNVILVRFSSPDPERAALVANTVVTTYIADRRASDDAAAERANQFLDRTLNELKSGVETAENAIEAFRAESGILGSGGLSVLREKVSQLANQAVRAGADRALAEARLVQAEQLLLAAPSGDGGGLQSGLANELKFQETNILRRIADLKTRFREQHPSVLAAQDELREIRRAIRDEVRKIVIGLENDLNVARQRENEIDRELAIVEEEIARQNASEIKLESLREAAVSARDLYEKALERLNLVQLRDDFSTEQDIRVISNAVVPEEPFAPRKGIILIAAIVVGAALGVMLSVLLEVLRSGFYSVSQIEQVLNLPVLSVVPKIDDDPMAALEHYDPVGHPLAAAYAESVRKLRTTMALIDPAGAPKSVMLTSALSGEGKSTLSLSLAYVAARIGQRVLLIDCDLRNPTVHKHVGRYDGPGLTEYLVGEAELDDIVEFDLSSGHYFIAAGAKSALAADLILSDKLGALIREVEGQFDLVVLDSPPVAPVSDSLFLSRLVDRVIYVVRSEKTARDVAGDGLQDLREAGGVMAGVVLSQADWIDVAYGPYYDRSSPLPIQRRRAA